MLVNSCGLLVTQFIEKQYIVRYVTTVYLDITTYKTKKPLSNQRERLFLFHKIYKINYLDNEARILFNAEPA